MSGKSSFLVGKRNSEVFLRPRFTIDLKKGKNKVIEQFVNVQNKKNIKVSLKIVDNHVFIAIPKKDDHFWSPQLHLEIVEKNLESSLLKGLFGPKPQVWTLFMFIHFIIGFAFIVFCILLYTRWSLNESVFFPILMLIVLPLVWILLYTLGKVGKSTGKHQMKVLHDFMLEVINI